jgi:Holliday junction resolvase YEN1
LLSLNITPLFVFDGPNRPTFKRNQKTNTQVIPGIVRLVKMLLKPFGCPFHIAPGEAEAECAVLNKARIVDAVLSEDVDTLMFGAHTVMRNWSAEGTRATKSPTHVTIYDSETIEAEAGLTREGMVLVALMRGGDYLPGGVPGCGIKTALEAARAGFGEDLHVVKNNEERLSQWRERLQYELETNKSGWFRRRKGAIRVAAGFPSMDVLGFYATPVVSEDEEVERLRDTIMWDSSVDVTALREYTRETFGWRGISGASKFVRTLAPALLSKKVWDGAEGLDDLITGLHGRRGHFSTDGCLEIRVSYVPVNVVPINKQLEETDDELLAYEQPGVEMGEERPNKGWSPHVAERIWMLESFLVKGMKNLIDNYNNVEAAKSKRAPKEKSSTAGKLARKKTINTKVASEGLVQTSLHQFLKISKNVGNRSPSSHHIERSQDKLFTSRTKPPISISASAQTMGISTSDEEALALGNESTKPSPKPRPRTPEHGLRINRPPILDHQATQTIFETPSKALARAIESIDLISPSVTPRARTPPVAVVPVQNTPTTAPAGALDRFAIATSLDKKCCQHGSRIPGATTQRTWRVRASAGGCEISPSHAKIKESWSCFIHSCWQR